MNFSPLIRLPLEGLVGRSERWCDDGRGSVGINSCVYISDQFSLYGLVIWWFTSPSRLHVCVCVVDERALLFLFFVFAHFLGIMLTASY